MEIETNLKIYDAKNDEIITVNIITRDYIETSILLTEKEKLFDLFSLETVKTELDLKQIKIYKPVEENRTNDKITFLSKTYFAQSFNNLNETKHHLNKDDFFFNSFSNNNYEKSYLFSNDYFLTTINIKRLKIYNKNEDIGKKIIISQITALYKKLSFFSGGNKIKYESIKHFESFIKNYLDKNPKKLIGLNIIAIKSIFPKEIRKIFYENEEFLSIIIETRVNKKYDVEIINQEKLNKNENQKKNKKIIFKTNININKENSIKNKNNKVFFATKVYSNPKNINNNKFNIADNTKNSVSNCLLPNSNFQSYKEQDIIMNTKDEQLYNNEFLLNTFENQSFFNSPLNFESNSYINLYNNIEYENNQMPYFNTENIINLDFINKKRYSSISSDSIHNSLITFNDRNEKSIISINGINSLKTLNKKNFLPNLFQIIKINVRPKHDRFFFDNMIKTLKSYSF
jgi:hypothetical protein